MSLTHHVPIGQPYVLATEENSLLSNMYQSTALYNSSVDWKHLNVVVGENDGILLCVLVGNNVGIILRSLDEVSKTPKHPRAANAKAITTEKHPQNNFS